jgi:hypothetical protein
VIAQVRAAPKAGGEGVDCRKLIGGEFELDTSMFPAIRCGVVDFGITERPCWRCQRSMT